MENQEQIFEEMRSLASEKKYPIILNESKDFLLNLINKYKPQNMLEIGTCIGYSGSLMLLSGDQNSQLTTIELNPNSHNIANQYFGKFNLSSRVVSILGDAKDEILKLDSKFDFIFLDGPKAQYKTYLPSLIALLNMGGVLFADNVYFKGFVQKSEQYFIPRGIRSIVKNLKLFIKMVQENKNLHTEIFEVGDGICVCTKIKE